MSLTEVCSPSLPETQRVSHLGLEEQETKGTVLSSCPQWEAEEPDQSRQVLETPSLRQLSHSQVLS